MKKRIAAMVLAGAMALSLAPAYGVTEVKAEAGDMKIAMVTDSGDITDQSFNQTTYEAVSYTHLDVYKRQPFREALPIWHPGWILMRL